MNGRDFLDDSLRELRKLKGLAERAIAQLPDDALFSELDGANISSVPLRGNSLAIVMKHMAGNMRSRWTDFLTTDGEKPDRRRDTEFVLDDGDTPEQLHERWQQGWAITLDSIGSLEPADLERSVTIRGEPHTVPQAIMRQSSHYAYHVGQLVHLARHLAGDDWEYLSVAPGKSAEYDVTMDGKAYLVNPGNRG